MTRRVVLARSSKGLCCKKCSRERANTLPLKSRETTSSKWLLSKRRLLSTLVLRLKFEVASKTSITSTTTERPRWWKRETKGYENSAVIDTILRRDRSNQMQNKATLSPWSCHTKTRPNIGQKTSIASTANATTPTFIQAIQPYRQFRSRNFNRLSDSRQSICRGIIRADKFLTLTWIHLIPSITWLLSSKIGFDSIITLRLPTLRSTAPLGVGKWGMNMMMYWRCKAR